MPNKHFDTLTPEEITAAILGDDTPSVRQPVEQKAPEPKDDKNVTAKQSETAQVSHEAADDNNEEYEVVIEDEDGDDEGVSEEDDQSEAASVKTGDDAISTDGDNNGKLAGRFATQEELERGYLELLGQQGKQGNKFGAYRKALEAKGVKFDSDGNIVDAEGGNITGTSEDGAGAGKSAGSSEREPAAKPSHLPSWAKAEAVGDGGLRVYQNDAGEWRDVTGTLYVTEAQWAEMKELDPDAYNDYRMNWMMERAENTRKFNEARIERGRQGITSGREALRKTIAEIEIPAVTEHPLIAKAMSTAEEVVARMSPEMQADPDILTWAFQVAMGKDFATVIRDAVEAAVSAGNSRGERQVKVLGTTRSSGAPAPVAGAKKVIKLTKAQLEMAKKWDMTPEEYAKHADGK